MQVQQKRECQAKIKRKTPEQRSSSQKYLTCQAKPCPGNKLIHFCALSRYHTNILLRELKFTPIPQCNNIELNIQNYTRRLQLAEFFPNKEANKSEENLFQKQSTFTPTQKRDRDLDHQIDVLNNLNLEKMEKKSIGNLSNME